MQMKARWQHGGMNSQKKFREKKWQSFILLLCLNYTSESSPLLFWWSERDYVIKSLTSLLSLCSWHLLREPYVASDTRTCIHLQTRTLASTWALSEMQTQTSGAAQACALCGRGKRKGYVMLRPMDERFTLKRSADPEPMVMKGTNVWWRILWEFKILPLAIFRLFLHIWHKYTH